MIFAPAPNFAAFASLREIFRIRFAALPRWVLRGEDNLDFLFVEFLEQAAFFQPV